jgi:hypothetical protein
MFTGITTHASSLVTAIVVAAAVAVPGLCGIEWNGWLWQGGYTGHLAAAAVQKNYPTLTTDQAAHFVIAAYENLCPVRGRYDWWAYSTS